jgi:hypothetical protein
VVAVVAISAQLPTGRHEGRARKPPGRPSAGDLSGVGTAGDGMIDGRAHRSDGLRSE